ncbi:MAG: ATP-binding cassette domain-containing protein [Proteobacteria bacterium]|nr:ATP-binding cassette domain-containing protein [Pseudomonadota bacterium]
MTSTKNMLEARGLCKQFGPTVALEDFSLTVPEGEVVCLLGANGAGKTTTINLFLGFLQPDRGEALVGGIDVAEAPFEARRRLAYLPESVALYPKLTGLENLSFFDQLAGGSRSPQDLSKLLLDAGFPKEAHHRRAATYSKGMRQKVGIAIATARQARALLLDEPLSGLDPSAASTLGVQIGKLRDDGCAVMMATHDIFRAKEVGDRIGIMMHGKLVNMLDAASLDAREIEQIYLEHLREADASRHQEHAL